MTNEKREIFRQMLAFITSTVAKKGNEKFGNNKFSFQNLIIVERDDKIKASKGKPIKELAAELKMSRKQVYKVLRRK